MEKIPMTIEGFENLEEEMKRLKLEERPAVIKAIGAAREHGDLSENAEYHAARERQGFIEGRLAELEDSGKLSVTSPLSRALIGKVVGDSVEVTTPGGSKLYEIIKIQFK